MSDAVVKVVNNRAVVRAYGIEALLPALLAAGASNAARAEAALAEIIAFSEEAPEAPSIVNKTDIDQGNGTFTASYIGAATVPLLDVVREQVLLSRLGVPGPNNDYTAAFAARATSLQYKALVLDVPEFRIHGTYSNLNNIHFLGQGENGQTTWRFAADLVFENCNFFDISGVALLPSTGYDGKGLHFAGTSSSNDIHGVFASGFTQEAIAYIGTEENKQSNNKIRDFLITDCGDETHAGYTFQWSQDPIIDLADVGSAPEGAGIAKFCAYIADSQEGTYLGGRHWNAQVAAMFERCSAWKINGARFEESQRQNLILRQCYRMTVSATHCHTGSEAATGVYSSVLLDGGTSNCELVAVMTRSFDDNFDHLHGIQIQTDGCTNNIVTGGIDLDFVGQGVSGANINGNRVFNRYPFLSDSLGPIPIQLHGEAVPVGVDSYLSPTGLKPTPGASGFRFPEAGKITDFRVYFDAPPTPGEYVFEPVKAGVSQGVVTATGGFAIDFPTAISGTKGEFFVVRVAPSGTAPVTDMEAVFTFRPGT